jgi:RHS repeat-associated protein
VTSFKYDYQGRRVKKVVYGNPDVVTIYLYDGDSIIRDFNERGIIQRTYYYGPRIDEPIAMLAGSSTYYYHFDGLGSVTTLSNSSGQLIEKYTYDVFGKPTIRDANNSVVSVSSVANRYMFTGREFESETGLYYYRARFYKLSTGRFLQTDPVGYRGGLNLYAYVMNNSVNNRDPSGLCCDTEALADCMSNANDAFQECLGMGAQIRDACLETANKWYGTCMADCKGLFFPANVVCMAGCNLGAGVMISGCLSAYAGWQTGCGISFAANMEGCFAAYCPGSFD